MSTKNKANDPNDLSFIEKARRAQIVQCAIETIAEIGYAQASIGQIAKRANVSKGVITYHFASKDDLLEEVVAAYAIAAEAFIRPVAANAATPKERLRKYMEANLAFIAEHRKMVFAVVEIAAGMRTKEGKLRFSADADESIYQPIEEILYAGAEAGCFREFTPLSARVTALAIRHAIDGFSLELMRTPDLSVKEYTEELISIFERAVSNVDYE